MRPRATPTPPRRVALLVPLLLLALLPVLVLAPPVAAQDPDPGDGPARTGTVAAVEPEAPVEVRVSTLAPHAPTPGDPLQVAGRLVNTGSRDLRDLRVRLRLGARLDSRSAVQQADAEGAVTDVVRGTEVPVGGLPAGASTAFDLRTEVDRLRLSRRSDGVYPLQVEVRGRAGPGVRTETLGLVSTFLPWFAEPPTGVTRLAWLWPLVDEPRASPRGTRRGPLLLDDQLAAQLSDTGRLARLLRAARGAERGACPLRPAPPEGFAAGQPPVPCRADAVPVTYAVDPDLLATVVGMSGGYEVRTGPSTSRPGAGREQARAWLDSLRAALGTSALLALPYADADLRSLTGPGSDLGEDAGLAVREGTQAAAAVTGEQPVAGVAWAPPGPVTEMQLDAYTLTGARALVVGEDALPPRPARLARTPGARTPLRTASGRVTGLVVDEGLSRLLLPGATAGDRAGDTAGSAARSPRLAEQRWLAETAIVAAEAPGDVRTLLVAVPRDADVVPAVAAQALLDSGRVPWLCPVLLADVALGRERCPGGAEPRGGPADDRGVPVPVAEDPPALPSVLLDSVARSREQVDQLTLDVLARGDRAADTRARLLRGAFRAESTAWRERPQRGMRLADLLADDVADLQGRVKVLTGPVTLTSSRGELTVDVQNTLDQAVTVRVRLSGPSGARLETDTTGVQQVPPRTSVQVRVRAEPRTSGKFPVAAQLLDRDGDPFGAPSTFVLRSTRYGALALAVTGLGAAVLLVATGVRVTRRALGRG